MATTPPVAATGTPRKPPVFGPEPWSERPARSWSYEDVCDLVLFEPYALDHTEEPLPWRRVPAGRAALIERYFLSLASECRAYFLHHQAEEAPDLAVEVFRAADRPGFHQEHVRRRCRTRTGIDISDEKRVLPPRLRVLRTPGDRS